jgi:hypothetical protein
MYPIRVGMKTQVEINGKKFIMRILEGNKFDLNQPGFDQHHIIGIVIDKFFHTYSIIWLVLISI